MFSEGEKFPVAKKKCASKISCGDNSGDEISSSEIRRGENIIHQTRRKFHAAKFPVAKFKAAKISRGEISSSGILLGEKPHIFLVQTLEKH